MPAGTLLLLARQKKLQLQGGAADEGAQRFALVKVEKSTTWCFSTCSISITLTKTTLCCTLPYNGNLQLVHKVSEEALRSDGKRVDHSSDLMAHL